MRENEVAQLFEETMMPIGEAWEVLGFTEQYGRRYVLANAIEGHSLFSIYGRWYVSRAWLRSVHWANLEETEARNGRKNV